MSSIPCEEQYPVLFPCEVAVTSQNLQAGPAGLQRSAGPAGLRKLMNEIPPRARDYCNADLSYVPMCQTVMGSPRRR